MLMPPVPAGFPTLLTSLGPPVRYFPIRKFNRVANLVFFILFLAASIAVFFYGIFRTYTAYMHHGAAVIADELTVPLLVAIGLFLLAAFGGWVAYSNWNRGVLVCEQGFAVRSRKGIQNWRWEDIASIKTRIIRHYANGIYSGTTHEYTLLNTQNERLVVNDALVKVDELAAAVEEKIFPSLYESAVSQYNDGSSLTFGPLGLSKASLQFGKKTIPWEEIKEISLQRGELKIKKNNGGLFSTISISVSAIPNLRVLLAILDQVTGVKTG